ncbi:MAG: S-methyl-5-thioribose-1-phosphate isomerase [Candidatus Omnitrophota bacterium]
MSIATIRWTKGCVKLIDQRKLPTRLEYISCREVRTLWKAIRNLSVRGAPAIGVAAAYGVLLGLKDFKGSDRNKFLRHVEKVCDYIGTSRPTAVNLFNALARMRNIVREPQGSSLEMLKRRLRQEARKIFEEDRAVNRRMGRHGSGLIRSHQRILTICNAGALATVDYGTALGVMYSAQSQGKKFKVYACETRPLLQGARLTAWELLRQGIDTTLICDNMAASLMKAGQVDIIFTGADRIAANGDTANKIGTYNLAVLARYHHLPFYIVAPLSTFDLAIDSGEKIPIEERSRDEVIRFAQRYTAPQKVKVYNPAFDVTDHELITGIVTEYGIIRPPFPAKIKKIFDRYVRDKK